MVRVPKAFVVVLLVLNAMVLLGQVWPEGAPPFARGANITFLVLNAVYLIMGLSKRATT